jgi:hypothetical protein
VSRRPTPRATILIGAAILAGCYRSHELETAVPARDASSDAHTTRPLEPQWTELHPTGGPPCLRYDHFAVYDAARDVMWVGGGRRFFMTCEGTRDGQGWLDVWRLDLSTNEWSLAGTLPHGVAGCSSSGGLVAVLDARRDRIVIPQACAPAEPVEGGDLPDSTTGGVLELATMEWRDFAPAPSGDPGFALDEERDRAIAAAETDSLATLDLESFTFSVEHARGSALGSRRLVGNGDRFFSVGSDVGRGVVGSLDLATATWSYHRGSLRLGTVAQMVWDPVHRRILGFGGHDGGSSDEHWLDLIAGTYVIDPTVVDGASEHLDPMPRPRTNATFVWDAMRSRALLFGGIPPYGPRSASADVWALELVTR